MWFQVLVHGENFLMEVDGRTGCYGFYTTRFIEAANQEEAENIAIILVKNEPRIIDSVCNPEDSPPLVYVEEIEEIAEPDADRIQSGFAFFSEEDES
jgi:hypothetical protein